MFTKISKPLLKFVIFIFGLVYISSALVLTFGTVSVNAQSSNFDLDKCRSGAQLDFAVNRDIGPCTSNDGKILYECLITNNNPFTEGGRKGYCQYEVVGASSNCAVTGGQKFEIKTTEECKKQFEQVCSNAWDKPQYEWEMTLECKKVFNNIKPQAVTAGLVSNSFTKDSCKQISDEELKNIQSKTPSVTSKDNICKGLNNDIYQCGAPDSSGTRKNCVALNDEAKKTGITGDIKPTTGGNNFNLIAFLINMIANVITFLIWVVVQLLKFVLGIMGGMFTVFVTVNPADNKLLNVAYTPWQAVVNISNIVLISGIVFMGFGYILGLNFIKQSKGLQDFFLGILIIGAMMNFTFAASAAVVNVANGVGNIIYFGAGGLASQNSTPPSTEGIGATIAQRIEKCRELNKDNPGGGFVTTFICNVASISDVTSLAEGGDMGAAFSKMFGDPAVENIVLISIVALIYVFAIIAFAKVLFVLIVRIFGVWMLIVVSPLALVAWFSPLPMIKDFGKQWLDYFVKLSFAYPFFTFGITLVTLVIGKIGTAIRISTNQNASIDGSINTFAQGAPNAAESFFTADLIASIIVAGFSFGLVYLFGELFWKVFAVFWNAAKGVASTVWNKGGKQILGGARGLANEGIRRSVGGAKINFAQKNLTDAQGGLSRLQSELKGIGAKDGKTSQAYKDKQAQVRAQQRQVKEKQASLQRAKQFRENFTMQGWVDSKKDLFKDTMGKWGLDGEMEKKRSQFYVDDKKTQRYAKYARSDGGRKYLALKGDQTFGGIRRDDYDTEAEFFEALESKATSESAKNKLVYDKASTNGDKNRGRILKQKEEVLKDLIGQYNDKDGKPATSFDQLDKAQQDDLMKSLDADQKELLSNLFEDAINGPGGLGEVSKDLFAQAFLRQKENFAKLNKEAQDKFLGDEDTFGSLFELLPEDEFNRQIELKGASEKARDSMSRGSRSSSRVVKAFDQIYGKGFLQKSDPNFSADLGAGVAMTSGVVSSAKSRVGAIATDRGLDESLTARVRSDIDGKSKKIGDSYSNMVKTRLETASPSDLTLGEDGRMTLNKAAIDDLKNDMSSTMFGAGDITNKAELDSFLANTKLGADLANDKRFNDLGEQDQINYAATLRKALKDSYDGDENNHVLKENLSSTAEVFGADMSFNAQIDPAANDFKKGVDSFGSLWNDRTGARKDQDQGNNIAAKHFIDNGNEDTALEVLAMKGMVDNIVADTTIPNNVKDIAREYTINAQKLQASSDPKDRGVYAKAMEKNIADLKKSSPKQQVNGNSVSAIASDNSLPPQTRQKAQEYLNQVQAINATSDPAEKAKIAQEMKKTLAEVQKGMPTQLQAQIKAKTVAIKAEAAAAAAHIEAKKLQEKINSREGLQVEISGQAPITVNKQTISKIATPEELFADAAQFMSNGGNFSSIKKRLETKGVSNAEITTYENIFKGLASGKVDGRDQNSRAEKALDHMYDAVRSAGSAAGVGKQLGDRKKAASDHATSTVENFHKKTQTTKSAKDLLNP